MDIQFDTNGRNILTIGKQIDYLSMEITMLYSFDIILTNTAKIDFFLNEAGRSDVMTTTMPPMTKASLKQAVLKDTLLDEAGSIIRMQHNGRFNWLVQTCFPTLATAVSVAQGLPNVEGTIDLAEHMYKWIKTHRLDGLISRSGNNQGFQFTCDADWAGLHSITGEIKSRTGTLSTYGAMPVDWYSSLQKTIVST
jgi:hypothetical protein